MSMDGGNIAIVRSNRAEVRNPVLALPGARAIMCQPPEVREALAVLFYSVADDARQRSNVCWKQNKPPMAAYWRVSSVLARHIARALRRANRLARAEGAA
jgi:hypothetical protein